MTLLYAALAGFALFGAHWSLTKRHYADAIVWTLTMVVSALVVLFRLLLER